MAPDLLSWSKNKVNHAVHLTMEKKGAGRWKIY